jgi:hypothetical protein
MAETLLAKLEQIAEKEQGAATKRKLRPRKRELEHRVLAVAGSD